MRDAREQTIHFVSLGCAKNRVDTEVMLGVSDAEGYRVVTSPEEAEIIVVNTCGFIGPAKKESIDTILEMAQLKDQGRCERLVVAGCLSQRYPEELAEQLPEVDHFLGSSDMLELGAVLRREAGRMLVGNPAKWTLRASDPRRLSMSGPSAYVKIAEGCNRSCSFCAIPGIRGKQRSRAIADVVEEAQRLAEQGVVELNLVSQDTIAYGRDLDDRPKLAELVEALGDVPGIRWIRLHYLYPESLDDRLVALMAEHEKILPYVDMPLQHASDAMLRRMRRGHGGARLRKLVDALRERIPHLVFRTTFLVGHPGETEADFEELVDFVRWAEFDHLGVFTYSPEEGTRAYEMGDEVPAAVARKRQRQLMSIQRKISREKLRARIGTEIEVLVTGPSEESEYLLEGRYFGQAPEVDGKVILQNGVARPGEIRRALVTNAADYDLLADLLTPEGEWDAPPGSRRPRKRKVRLRTLA
ncbi:MAG: 30S ribosomal protein S12 methylthiotransferase RimO [Myxococcales bacterium]|nr:30S ribosomal protein S12 methylthiotransferase RimO [Myxococcales bacterium]